MANRLNFILYDEMKHGKITKEPAKGFKYVNVAYGLVAGECTGMGSFPLEDAPEGFDNFVSDKIIQALEDPWGGGEVWLSETGFTQ